MEIIVGCWYISMTKGWLLFLPPFSFFPKTNSLISLPSFTRLSFTHLFFSSLLFSSLLIIHHIFLNINLNSLHIYFHFLPFNNPPLLNPKTMSTDLNSPVIILNPSSNQPKNTTNNTHNYPFSSSSSNPKLKSQKINKNDEKQQEVDPLTPTSDEHKIPPPPRSPPPAPRKRRCGALIACRKKLDFIDQHKYPQLIIPKDEVLQDFFTTSFQQIHSRRLLKRRCPCI